MAKVKRRKPTKERKEARVQLLRMTEEQRKTMDAARNGRPGSFKLNSYGRVEGGRGRLKREVS